MYQPIGSIQYQNGLDVSAPPLSNMSQASLDDGSWNSIVSGNGFTRPWSGSTSQGADTGSLKMLPFGNTWGGIKSIGYSNHTFVAADITTGTDTITIASHGYQTGVSCTLTTTGTLPAGLALATTYYVIRTGTDTFKFASSLSNALAGTPAVDITGTGSGGATHTITVGTASITASGSFFQDIGKSRWGIGSGQPAIEGTSIDGFTLSTNLQLQIATAGVYASPVQAGLAQPSAPEIGIIATVGDVSNSVSAKISRTRPSTGAESLASPTSAVIKPQANRVRITFPVAATGQTHWRVYLSLQGFGGTGIHYLASYGTIQDIPEATVAAGSVSGAAAQATGTLTVATNPSDGETIVVNGVTLTFASSAFGDTQVQIGASTTDTAFNLASTLSASLNADLITATYLSAGNVVTISFAAFGTAGNSYTLANSSGSHVTRSGATLTGGSTGDFARSLEFNYKDGDLIPLEASFDNYPPPAATHALRLGTVLNLIGCYSDSTADPTSTSPGTAIAVSKENDYESYVPTSLLFLPEQVVDVLARPIDDYGYIACENSIHALQYIGDRGDGLPACTITTILPDIGIQYMQNWCHFRGRLLIYTAQGNLLMMDEAGNFDSNFASPVTKILKSFTPATTSVGYDPKNDSIVVLCGKRILVYSFQMSQWRQIYLPDYGIGGTATSCTTAKRTLYFTVTNGSSKIAYTYDTGSATAPLSFVSNYQNAGGAAVNDIYEMAISAQTDVSTPLVAVINRNLAKTVFRQVATNTGSFIPFTVADADATFYPGMVGKQAVLFGTDVGGTSLNYLKTQVAAFTDTGQIVLTANLATFSNSSVLWVIADTITIPGHRFVTGNSVILSSTGTLPTGLSPATTYYVIRIDHDTIQLATSSANAFAGTAIDLPGPTGTIPGPTHSIFSIWPTLTDCLMFVGDWAGVQTIEAAKHLPNFNPYLSEVRSHQLAVWLQGQTAGNVLTADLLGSVYASSRAL